MALFSVSGSLGPAIERFASMSEHDFAKAALDAGETVGHALVEDLQGRAYGEWSHIAESFEVFRLEENVAVGIDAESSNSAEAHALEYGDDSHAPMPLMRTTVTANHRDLSEQWSRDFEDRIFGG